MRKSAERRGRGGLESGRKGAERVSDQPRHDRARRGCLTRKLIDKRDIHPCHNSTPSKYDQSFVYLRRASVLSCVLPPCYCSTMNQLVHFTHPSAAAGRLNALALSADGSLALSASHTGVLVVMQLPGQEIRFRQDGVGQIKAACFASDGNSVLTGDMDGVVTLWDIERQLPRWSRPGPGAFIKTLAWSADGTQVAAGISDGSVWVGTAASGTSIRSDTLHNGHITGLSFSVDGTQLAAAGGMNSEIILYDVAAAQLGKTLKGNSGWTELAHSRDGKTLRSWCRANHGKTPRILTYETGRWKTLGKVQLAGHTGVLTGLGVSPEGPVAVSCSLVDGTLRSWDIPSATETWRGNEYCDRLALSADGRHALTAMSERLIWWAV